MDHVNYFKDLFESIPDFGKIVLLIISNKFDCELLNEYSYLKHDISRLCLEFKIYLLEQNKEYLEFIENEEESILERNLNK